MSDPVPNPPTGSPAPGSPAPDPPACADPPDRPRPLERAAHRLYAHVCWTTLARLPLLRPAVRAPLEGHLISLCRRLDAEPVAVTVLADRVHLLLRHKPAHSLARLVSALKRGGRQALARLGEPVSWGSGFAAASVGGREVRRVVRALAVLGEREEAAARPEPPRRGSRPPRQTARRDRPRRR